MRGTTTSIADAVTCREPEYFTTLPGRFSLSSGASNAEAESSTETKSMDKHNFFIFNLLSQFQHVLTHLVRKFVFARQSTFDASNSKVTFSEKVTKKIMFQNIALLTKSYLVLLYKLM